MIYRVLAYCVTYGEWVLVREFDRQDEALGHAKVHKAATGADTMVEVIDGGKH